MANRAGEHRVVPDLKHFEPVCRGEVDLWVLKS